jgi:hypothetical protein
MRDELDPTITIDNDYFGNPAYGERIAARCQRGHCREIDRAFHIDSSTDSNTETARVSKRG